MLIDGSVLANAPFRPAIRALQSRPARREVDRRFVYIDPKPGVRSVRLGGGGQGEAPGFFATIFGALSDIPREQPIRDNLEAIEQRSATIRRLRRIVEAMRPEVEAAIERAFGSAIFLLRPTPKRLAAWRARAQTVAAREAGYAYAAYGHLKLASVAEEAAERIFELGGGGDRGRHERVRQALWNEIRARGLAGEEAITATGARPEMILLPAQFRRRLPDPAVALPGPPARPDRGAGRRPARGDRSGAGSGLPADGPLRRHARPRPTSSARPRPVPARRSTRSARRSA